NEWRQGQAHESQSDRCPPAAGRRGPMRTAASTATCDLPDVATTRAAVRPAAAARIADYLMLTKPRISVLVLLTVSAGYALGSVDSWRGLPLVYALLGIALVAASSSAFNQLLERDSDARMLRTFDRPLPAGRLSPAEVLLFGVFTGLGGIVWLALFVNATTAVLTALTLVLYAGLYTPLKRRT